MRLNFEILLGIYDPEFTKHLGELQQQRYIDGSHMMDFARYQRRSGALRRIAENFARCWLAAVIRSRP